MAKIRANELFEKEDIFQGIRESAEKTMVTLDKIDEEFKKIGATLKNDISKAKFGGAKELKEFMQMVEKANNLQRDTIKLEKEKAIAEQQSEKLKQQKIRTQTAENRQQERINKQKQKAVKLAKDEKDAYKQLVKATRDLKNESKTLGAQMLSLEASGKKNTEQYRKLSRQYKQVTASAKQGDAQLKKLDKTVGDNFRNVGNYRGAISKLRNGLAQLGLAFGLSQVVRSSMNTIVDYGTANSKLASILGTTTDKTKQLQKVQRELGASTSFTAGEVAELQTELAKIGFSQQDIADSTEGILLLAKASGTDLANASTIAGATLRGFGLDVKDTSHLADVMAKSFSSSALDIGLFGESMKYVAPVSKSANISLEETTALLSILADNGIKGSQAGTSLKRIISELAKTGKPLEEALKDVADAGIDLVSAQDEVGRSAQTSLLILSDNIEKIDEFSEKYEKADGSARAMADTMDDNLAGSLARLNSKWEDFLLGVNDSSGASSSFRVVLDFLAKNLTTIITILAKLIRTYVLYKATLKGIQVSQYLYNNVLKAGAYQISKNIKNTRAYRLEQIKLARGTKQTATATSQMGQSLKGLGLMAIIGLVTELAVRWYDVASGTRNARMEAESFAKAETRASEKVGKETQYWRDIEKQDLLEIKEQLADNKITQERADELEVITKKQIANQFDNLSKNRQKDKNILDDYMNTIDALNVKLKNLDSVQNADEMRKTRVQIQQELDNLNTALITFGLDGGYEVGTSFWSNFVGDPTILEQLTAKFKGSIEQVRLETIEYNKEAVNLRNEARELVVQQKEGAKGFIKFKGELSDTTDKKKHTIQL